MAFDTDVSYIYEKILKNARYDNITKRYLIAKEDYIHLNLSKKQLKLLRMMCNRCGIELEAYDYRLPSVEDEKLFQEYNKLKIKLQMEPGNEDLERRRVVIRNKIVTSNLELVRAIIDRNFDGIHEMIYKEEIYQLGYEVLLDYVNTRDIMYPGFFTQYISSKLISVIRENFIFLDKGLTSQANKDLEKMKKAKIITSSIKANPTTIELARSANLDKKRVEELLNLENLLNAVSIDEEKESINDNDGAGQTLLYDNTFEEKVLLYTVRDLIVKIIDTLPVRQKEIIMLSFGFQDGKCYSDIEISKILNISNMRVGIIKREALENLRLSLRSKYLIEFYDTHQSKQKESATKKQEYVLEEILLDYIPMDEMYEYLKHISSEERYVFSLYHGLVDGKKLNLREISETTGLNLSRVHKAKQQACEKIKNQILTQHFKEQKDTITNVEYLDYLMKKYVISKNSKSK